MTAGCYGLLVIPGACDRSSTIHSIENTVNSPEKIEVSTYQTAKGYDILINIPWECIGGIPATDSFIGFDVILNDRDIGVRRDVQMLWSGCYREERTYLKQDSRSLLRYGLLHIKEV